MTVVIENIFDIDIPLAYKWWWAPICFAILFPMVMVRKIQTFAKFHVFGDVMVALMVIVCMSYATSSVAQKGWQD